jgi:hypothetical protein
MRVFNVAAAVLLAAFTIACHAQPIANTNAPIAGTGGTIAGVVRSEGGASLAARKVTAVNTMTGARFEATTGANGGYTIKVPPGTYRLECDLMQGEVVSTQPPPTDVNVGDLDAQRDFVVGGR